VALRAVFVRRRGQRDRVYVTRTDGSTTGWDFPSYGDGLPHDLCHLVIEDALGLRGGFWGLVDRGTEVALVDNQATLMRDGQPLASHQGADIEGLLEAEQVVARLSGLAGGTDQPTSEAESIATQRLDALRHQWGALADGEAITLSYGTASPPRPHPHTA
jgi:hypothetical protein